MVGAGRKTFSAPMRAVIIALLAALAISGLEVPLAAAASAAEAVKQADPPVTSRPDVVSAAVTARARRTPIEVESLRTETTTTWANPDGTMTTDAHAAAIRFRDAAGRWQDVDLNWRHNEHGGIVSGARPLGLSLGRQNGKAGAAFAAAAANNEQRVEWAAPWALPEPTLDGTKATYSNVQPETDLVVHSRRSGFEFDLVVKRRPATAPVWRIPLRTKGLTATQQPDGSIAFLDGRKQVHSTIAVPFMWDAATDQRSGEPLNKVRLGMAVEQANQDGATLVITPDPAWFNDPKRAFPVTVDPTYAVGTAFPSFDTWAQSDYTSDQSTSPELKLGTYNGGAVKARSFLNFPTAPYKGKQILSARLFLFETWSYSCTPSSFGVRSATPATTATRWTAQPTIGSQYGSLSVAKGHDAGCPAGRISVPITDLVKAWSTASYPTGGMALMAANESDSNSWKRFHSTEGSADPYISFTYNRPPAVPAKPTMINPVAYAPPGGSVAHYTPYRRPWAASKATDADGNNVRYIFEFHTSTATSPSTLKATCSSVSYPSGTTAGCQPSVDLPDNTTIVVRAKSTDGFLESSWSGWASIRVGAATPAPPTISCPAPHGNGSWSDTQPAANVVCTITATGTGYNAPGYVRATVDGAAYPTNFTGGAPGQIKITPSSDPNVAKTTVTVSRNAGLHTLKVQAETPAGRLSGAANYSFGYGAATLNSPAASPRLTTTGGVKITASGPPKGSSAAPTAALKWRLSGYGGSSESIGWNTSTNANLTVTDNGAAGVSVSGTWNSMAENKDSQLDSDPNTAGIQPTELNDRVPALLDVQVCLTYTSSTQCTWSQTKTSVLRVPHAFGDGFPTSQAGPGQVALWTGEFHTEATDISVPGYTGELTLSRSHSTFAGPTDTVTGVFGPGWTARFDGADAGVAGMRLIDNTRGDGTIVLVDGEGSALVFESPSGTRRTTANLQAGTWVPADDDTAQLGAKLTVAGTGAGTTIAYTEDNGTVTTFATTAADAPTASTAGKFRPASITESGVAGKTTYAYDTAGRVSRILAPTAPGITCVDGQGVYTHAVGCRSVRLEYGTSGSANGRLTTAWLDIFNPGKAGGAGMDSIKVASYTYDPSGRLATATDPRTNLSTSYGYDSANRVTSLTPAGQVPYQFAYTPAPNVKLANVKRDRPAGDPTGGTAALASFVYDVPVTGPGLPDVSRTSVDRWSQTSAPAKGFAVFGADRPVTSTSPDGIGQADWEFANLQYTDDLGYTVNTAEFGAGAWQYSATDYNAQGNIARTLDERALRLIIDGKETAANQLATIISYNADIKNGETVVTPAGTLVTETFGPSRTAALRDGSVQLLRTRTVTQYDQGAPNGGINAATGMPYRLPTTETTYAHDPGSGQDIEAAGRSFTGYAPVVAGDPDGWATGQSSTTTTDVNLDGAVSSVDITKVTRHDTEGRVVETRQPSSNGADAGTKRTAYYTAAAHPTYPACGNKPQWAGMVCAVYPAAAPSSGAPLPTTTTTEYSYLLDPATVVETSGAVTRTRTTGYLADGRAWSKETAVTGLASSNPNSRKETTYDPASGLPTQITAKGPNGAVLSTVSTGYDGWGRKTSYTTSNETTTTAYDASGGIASVTDANGSTRYSYDGVDAEGRNERRGIATKVEVTTAGATWTATSSYDADGDVVTRKLPGGLTQQTERDNAGEPTGMTYSGQSGAWLSWSQDNDVLGRVVREWTPEGAAFTGPPAGEDPDEGDAVPYDRGYSYDAAGRLVEVRDRTAATTGVDVTDPAEAPGCVTRTYGFDGNHNRLGKTTRQPGTDGACSASGGTTATRAFDTADRPISAANGQGAYVYDELGRTRTLPSADAPNPQHGDISLAYYDNDLPRSIVQGGVTTTYALDASDRRTGESVADDKGSGYTAWHYTDESDNPTWIASPGSTRRFAQLGGDLSLTVDQAGRGEVTIANLHGDVVSSAEVANAGATATAISAWDSFDEYGNRATPSTPDSGEPGYGWLGGKQRAESGAGLVLMGVRLYNPATGLFTSTDPVEGGGANAYAYPTDPVNMFDLDGQVWFIVIIAIVVIRVAVLVCMRVRWWCGSIVRWAGKYIMIVARWVGGKLGQFFKWIGAKIWKWAKWAWKNKIKAVILSLWEATNLLGQWETLKGCYNRAKKHKWYKPWKKIWACIR